MILLLAIAFVSGFATILAPCIWPLLPIVFSSSVMGGRRRAFGISLGIVSSFAVFTLLTSYIVSVLRFDPNILRIFAVLVIGFFGLVFVIPAFSKRLEAELSKFSGKFGSGVNANKTGFWGGLALGIALGIVWTPCAGPILATVATLAATKAVNWQIVIVTLVYCLGVGVPLFLFTSFGQRFFAKSQVVSKYTGRIQQILGIVMILTALAIYTGYDRVLELKLLGLFPSYSNILNGFEGVGQKQLDTIRGKNSSKIQNFGLVNLQNYGSAPEFVGITNWLNSKPLKVADLRGKVVLVDFWTYTCINCIRTLPYVTSWYEKYHDKGFIVVGVHTPEFEFEKNTANVANALKQYKINYPVAQDNDYKTWDNYNNQYWPADYLIDANGNIREVHFGEGNYKETETAIRELLAEAGNTTGGELVNIADQTPGRQITPETYLGKGRMERFSSPEVVAGGVQVFTLPDNLGPDNFAYQGSWDTQNEFAQAQGSSELVLNFNASKVFLVMQPGNVGEKIKVYLDGKVIDNSLSGIDVKNGEATIDFDRLYNLVDLKGGVGRHLLRLQFSGRTRVYAFTFG